MYPPQIKNRISNAARSALKVEPNATGRAATFLCGVSIDFDLCIEELTGKIEDAAFRTNGCGYVIASADFLAREIKGVKLVELHALHELEDAVIANLEEPPVGRKHCFDICFDALQNVLADYRLKLVEGWNGEDALVCSCFGVSETKIEREIETANLLTVEEVGDSCNAGTGCGSCQPIIQEILDRPLK